jgi:hypothetical protein
MSADPTNGQSNIDVILKAMAPDRREAFLKSRNRLKQFNENDEILALAHYLDTVVVMVDGLTKNVAAAMTAHTEPMANLTAQLKRVAAELPSHANTLTPKTIRHWLACWAASILLVAPAAFFWGWISAQREQSNRLAAALSEAPQMGPWVAAHGGWATFHPTKDEKGNLFHALVLAVGRACHQTTCVALINGTTFMSAAAALLWEDSWRVLRALMVALALTRSNGGHGRAVRALGA